MSYALTYISSVLPSTRIKPASVTILADNDYYSQPSGTRSSSLNNNHQFTDFGVRLHDAHKTGLGSSAALVTALTGAILSHYLPESHFFLSSKQGRARIHNLAQAVHCAAQGKVGSGFDVAAAVYGTCIYRRFSPSILSSLGEPGSPGFSNRLLHVVEDTDPNRHWDTEISKGGVTIPEGMSLIMCDVDCGSQTVGMVKKVLEWRKQDASSSKALWDELQSCNDTLASTLSSGSFDQLVAAFSSIREKIRDMSTQSRVPIEPPEQTELLNSLTNNIEGVAGGVVPGAGGYDAVVLLIKDDKDVVNAIETFLAKWSAEKKSNVKLLSAKGELEGAKLENGMQYSSLIK